MSKILLKPDELGNVMLSKKLIKQLKKKRVELEVSEEEEILLEVTALKPEEKIGAFRDWVSSFPKGVGLSDWAVSRESIYD